MPFAAAAAKANTLDVNIQCCWYVSFLMGNITPFLSSTDEVMSMDQRLLKVILESHILKDKIVLGQLYNGQRLETIGGKLLRVFIYRTVRPLL